MKWFERLARWVEHRGGMRELYRPHPVTGQPTLYMRRFYLAKTPFGEAMLHQFFMGDEGGLHDHPWFSFGRILAKGYREHLCEKVENGAPVGEFVVERRPGEEGQVWTLFVTGPRKTVWGFLSENGWIPFSEYFKKDGTSAKQATPDQYRGWFFPRKVA